MSTSRTDKLLRGPIILVAGVIALTAAAGTNSEACARKAALTKAITTHQEKPIKLRYYGGPKSPMYPQ